ncbi:hypothetical protein SAMN05414137_107171 [Streptacidiphilus jiangxiensis]|uniref:DUF3592 domain-containing protein n=2 Tax=Streptacidiphilus jiangxiensis TaxID=235985 RepID=A0A1H7P1Z0_STRJI|nr:hypothetical protein SAMN05414137_107171 [Streptacidiphilus jiangxiensis]
MVCLTLVLALGMFVAAAGMWLEADSLNARGVRTTARVLEKARLGHGSAYRIAFDTPDHRSIVEWSYGLPDGISVGDRITVVYQASDPSGVQEPGAVHREPWAAASAGVVGILLLWQTRRLFRMDPDSPGWGRRRRPNRA